MLPRDWTPVQRFEARDRWGRTGLALPVRPSPFPAGSFGSSRSCVVTGFDAGDSSLRVALLLEATPCDRTHLRRRVHLSWGSVPLQRSTTGGARISRWLTSPPAPSVHRVSHPLNGLLRPRSCQALATGFRPPFRPDCAPGVPPASFGSRLVFTTRAGPTDSEFPLQGSPQPRDERVFARSPLVRFAGAVVASFRDAAGRVNDGRYRVSIAGPSALPR